MKLPMIAVWVLLSGCVASRTTIQSSWADEAYSGPPLARLAVVALFETRAESLSFEKNAAEYFAMHGVETVPGHTLLTPHEAHTLDEAEVRRRLATTEVDGL